MFLIPIIAAAVCVILAVVFIINAIVWRKNKVASRIFVLLAIFFFGVPAVTGLAFHFNWTSNPYDLVQTLVIAMIYILGWTTIEVPLISKTLSGIYYERKIVTSVLIANTATSLLGYSGLLQGFMGDLLRDNHLFYGFILFIIITVPIEMLINNLILKSQYKSKDIIRLTFYSNLLSYGIISILEYLMYTH